MRRRSKILIGALAVVGLLVLVISGAAFAASPATSPVAGTASAEAGGWGEPGLCTGPGAIHRWSESGRQGACLGDPSLCTGPGDMHRWGKDSN